MKQRTAIQLIIAWTLTAVFVFTAIATTLSLIGWLRFDHPGQQERLFYVLIIEVVVVVVGFFRGFLRLWPEGPAQSPNDCTTLTTLNTDQDNERWGWDKAEEAAQSIYVDLTRDDYRPTLLVGTGRGGAIMGALLSGCFGHIPLVVIDRKYDWTKGRRVEGILFNVALPPRYLERVLLLDGEAHTGLTMRFYVEYFKRMGARRYAQGASSWILRHALKKSTMLGSDLIKCVSYPGCSLQHLNTRRTGGMGRVLRKVQ